MDPSTSSTASAVCAMQLIPCSRSARCEFIHADMFLRHVRFDGLSVVNQQGRLALDELPETAIRARHFARPDSSG